METEQNPNEGLSLKQKILSTFLPVVASMGLMGHAQASSEFKIEEQKISPTEHIESEKSMDELMELIPEPSYILESETGSSERNTLHISGYMFDSDNDQDIFVAPARKGIQDLIELINEEDLPIKIKEVDGFKDDFWIQDFVKLGYDKKTGKPVLIKNTANEDIHLYDYIIREGIPENSRGSKQYTYISEHIDEVGKKYGIDVVESMIYSEGGNTLECDEICFVGDNDIIFNYAHFDSAGFFETGWAKEVLEHLEDDMISSKAKEMAQGIIRYHHSDLKEKLRTIRLPDNYDTNELHKKVQLVMMVIARHNNVDADDVIFMKNEFYHIDLAARFFEHNGKKVLLVHDSNEFYKQIEGLRERNQNYPRMGGFEVFTGRRSIMSVEQEFRLKQKGVHIIRVAGHGRVELPRKQALDEDSEVVNHIYAMSEMFIPSITMNMLNSQILVSKNQMFYIVQKNFTQEYRDYIADIMQEVSIHLGIKIRIVELDIASTTQGNGSVNCFTLVSKLFPLGSEMR